MQLQAHQVIVSRVERRHEMGHDEDGNEENGGVISRIQISGKIPGNYRNILPVIPEPHALGVAHKFNDRGTRTMAPIYHSSHDGIH